MNSPNNGISDIIQKILETCNLLGLKEKDIQTLQMTAKNYEKITINCPAHAYNNSAGLYGTISIRDF